MEGFTAGAAESPRTTNLRLAARRTLELYAFGVLPLFAFCWWIGYAALETGFDVSYWGFDTWQYWRAGRDVLEGDSPYPSADAVASAGPHLDAAGLVETFRFAYPAASAVAFAPLGLVSFEAAAVIWCTVVIACVFAALWIVRARDWRVYGVVVGSAPVIASVRIGTLTPVLLVLLTVAWRWRDRRLVAAAALSAAIALKLFLWPLVVWLAATRRWLEAIATCVLAAAVTFLGWAVIGFDGLSGYPELLRRLTDIVEERGYSTVALASALGLPGAAAHVLPLAIGLPLLIGVAVASRGRHGDRVAFSLAVVASIALTPIVWAHYFALLVVPLAIVAPRLSWAWGVMWLFWLGPAQENGGELWRIVVALAAVGAIAFLMVRSTRTPSTALVL